MLPRLLAFLLLLVLCAGSETTSESPYRTPSSSSHSPPGELKKAPSRRAPAKLPVEVNFSAYFIDRDVIRIAQDIYPSLNFAKFLDTLSPTESTIDDNLQFLSVVGPDDEFKVFGKGTKAALVIPVDPGVPGIVEDLQFRLGYKKPIYRLTWVAEMEKTRNSKERYLYTLEADYTITRAKSVLTRRPSNRMGKNNLNQPRRSSKQATMSGSRGVSRSSSYNDFKEIEGSPGSEESEDPYRAEYRLSAVNICLQNID